MEQSHQLPSLYSLAVWEKKKSLFRPGKMVSFQAGMNFSEGGFFQQFPLRSFPKNMYLTSTGKHRAELYWLRKKAAQGNRWGFALSWSLFHVMQWKFWSFFGWLNFWQLFPLFYNAVIGQEHYRSVSSVTVLLLPRYCILRCNEQSGILM